MICRVINPLYIPPAGEGLLNVNLEDSETHLPLSAVDFGVKFSILMTASKLNSEQERYVKLRCRDSIVEAARQVQLRLPPNMQHWNSMKSFSPGSVLSQVKAPLQDEPLLKLFKGDVGLLDTQYRSLCLLPGKKKNQQKKTNKDDASLSVEVLDCRDASGERCFKEIAEFALSLFAMRLSNADVDRVFSHMNVVKLRYRNIMKNPMLSGILHVRYGLEFRGICCQDFQLTARMSQLFHPKNMYGSAEVEAEDFPDESDTCENHRL
ncbi:hypothetical protein HPB47_001868 [Ixodes persulcatus]|uniref:Uncharacterized protein n=1 Tax=Ixodes persulcatus TaxID=34615 RepID=A0AC60PN28_IXOPE|nr:hypothetical protein HPB47_001868 [Ixodes persulcatus]